MDNILSFSERVDERKMRVLKDKLSCYNDTVSGLQMDILSLLVEYGIDIEQYHSQVLSIIQEVTLLVKSSFEEDNS